MPGACLTKGMLQKLEDFAQVIHHVLQIVHAVYMDRWKIGRQSAAQLVVPASVVRVILCSPAFNGLVGKN